MTYHSTWHLLWRQTLVLKSSGSHEKPMKFWRELGSLPKPQTSNPNMHRRTDRELPIVVLIARHGQIVQGFGSGARQVSQRLPLHQGNVLSRSFILLLQPILSLLIPQSHSLCTISKFPGGNNASYVVNWILVTFLSSVRNTSCVIRIMCISSIASWWIGRVLCVRRWATMNELLT